MIDAAAANNAAWCHAFCASHGIVGRFGVDAWSSPLRTPPLYPDAVTLRPTADAGAMLALVDDGPGCSVKDSFARLDLEDDGYHRLVRASWFTLVDRPDPAPPGWRRIASAAELAAWERAWSGAEPRSFFRPQLLEDESIDVLARFERDEIVAGAIANRAAGVTGLTNVFGADAWRGAAAFAEEPVVCWETESPPGFECIGELAIWLRD